MSKELYFAFLEQEGLSLKDRDILQSMLSSN